MLQTLQAIKPYQTLIVGVLAFAGVIVTLGGTFLVNGMLARLQHRRGVQHERAVVRTALRAELQATADSYRDRISIFEKPPTHDGALVPLDAMTDIYKSLITRLGLLSQAEIEAVLRAYLLVEQLPSRVRLFELSQSREPGQAFVRAEHFDNLVTLHRNYLRSVAAAIAAIQDAGERNRTW